MKDLFQLQNVLMSFLLQITVQLQRYKQDCGHEKSIKWHLLVSRLFIIRFGISYRRIQYALQVLGMFEEHGDRKRQTKLLVDAAKKYDLHIYDDFMERTTEIGFLKLR